MSAIRRVGRVRYIADRVAGLARDPDAASRSPGVRTSNGFRVSPEFAPAYYQLSRLHREQGDLQKSEEERKTFQRLTAQQRVKAMTRMLVEIHQREANR